MKKIDCFRHISNNMLQLSTNPQESNIADIEFFFFLFFLSSSPDVFAFFLNNIFYQANTFVQKSVYPGFRR